MVANRDAKSISSSPKTCKIGESSMCFTVYLLFALASKKVVMRRMELNLSSWLGTAIRALASSTKSYLKGTVQK